MKKTRMFRVFQNGETFNFVPEMEENTNVQLPEKNENDADSSCELDLGEYIELYCCDPVAARKFVEDKLYKIRRICKLNDIVSYNWKKVCNFYKCNLVAYFKTGIDVDKETIRQAFSWLCRYTNVYFLVSPYVLESFESAGCVFPPILLQISDISELDLEQFIKFTNRYNILGVQIYYDGIYDACEYVQLPYSKDDYLKILLKISELTSEIHRLETQVAKENAAKTKFEKDAIRLLAATKVISENCSYDDEAFAKRRLYGSLKDVSTQTLLGLLSGKSVCGGYSEIMRNVLIYLGFEAKYIIGKMKYKDVGEKKREEHAWNIVRLGGSWYNIDFTWISVYLKDTEKYEVTWEDFLSKEHRECIPTSDMYEKMRKEIDNLKRNELFGRI